MAATAEQVRGSRNRAGRAPDGRPPRGPARSVAVDQAFDGGSLLALRSMVAARAAVLADERTAEKVVLIAHELATNAVRHGGGSGRLRVWTADGRLWCEVSDRGPGLPDPATAGTRLPGPETPGGRGLWIARRMSALRISTGPGGTTITAGLPSD